MIESGTVTEWPGVMINTMGVSMARILYAPGQADQCVHYSPGGDGDRLCCQGKDIHWLRGWQGPTLGAHAHGFWVGMGVILLFMGGHGCDIIGHGWAWVPYYNGWA